MNVVAFALALAAPFIPALAATVLARRLGFRSRALWLAIVLLLASIVMHPLVQPFFLESWDTRANHELGNRFRASDLLGKSGSDVEAIFGKPDGVWSETPRILNAKGAVTWQGEATTAWEYQPLRFYWLGSRLQVVFRNGVVSNFEVNDD
jgi:hypothetical protein